MRCPPHHSFSAKPFDGPYRVIVGVFKGATSVTSKGQLAIPLELRQRLGIRQGSRVEFSRVDNHLEMHVVSSPLGDTGSGFGMLKSKRAAVPADFNSAMLLKPHR